MEEEEATMMIAPADQRREAAAEEEEERALAIWRAVQGSTSLRLHDVLAALRAAKSCTPTTPPTTTTTAAADDQLLEEQAAECAALVPVQEEEEELLEEVWWWLFVSQGDNACLAFLLGGDGDDEQQGTVARAHSNKVVEDGREEVFLALAPAVLDQLLEQRVACRDLRSKLRARLATESALVWQRVRQACSRVRQDGHRSTHNDDDHRQAELVRVLLHCLTGGGVRRWEETDLFEQVVLRHTNVAVVLGTRARTRAHNRGLLHTHSRALTRSRTIVHAQRASTTSWTMETTPTCCSSCSAIATSECARP
jgi:hypothetical protein